MGDLYSDLPKSWETDAKSWQDLRYSTTVKICKSNRTTLWRNPQWMTNGCDLKHHFPFRSVIKKGMNHTVWYWCCTAFDQLNLSHSPNEIARCCRSIDFAPQYGWCLPLIVLLVWHVRWRSRGWTVLKSSRPLTNLWTCSKNVGRI